VKGRAAARSNLTFHRWSKADFSAADLSAPADIDFGFPIASDWRFDLRRCGQYKRVAEVRANNLESDRHPVSPSGEKARGRLARKVERERERAPVARAERFAVDRGRPFALRGKSRDRQSWREA
jgi:hypothetical protein